MTYQLRDYQKSASDAAVSVFKSKEKKNYVIVLPTGAGKSLVIANIARKYSNKILRNFNHTAYSIVEFIQLLPEERISIVLRLL